MEIYSCKDNMILIQDEELGIDIRKPWDPPKLPLHPQHGEVLSQGARVVIHNFLDNSKRISSEKEGVFHGEWRLTYPSLKPKIITFYENGHLEGPFSFYSEEGTLLVESWFIEGMKEGRSRSYYLGGEKSSEERYRNNRYHGTQLFWFPDGTLKTSMVYNNGVLEGEVKLYYPNGKLFRSLEF